ncbi:MAG: polyprenyl synthetase family protein, partial [Bacteroidales bacterium]|nr:polyprenyl synthetase family protein [Bacteroidales bacterium]
MFTLQEIEAIVKKAIGTINFAKEPRNLYEPLEYMISIGGKRLRPRLCLTTFNLFSNQLSDDVLYPALALEIFHTFTLIHDDIMDKADTRRGMPT